jgi:hypothetical protein
MTKIAGKKNPNALQVIKVEGLSVLLGHKGGRFVLVVSRQCARANKDEAGWIVPLLLDALAIVP